MNALTPVQAVFIVIAVFNCVTGCVYAIRGDRRAGRSIAISAASGLIFLLTLNPVPRFMAAAAFGLTILGAFLMATRTPGSYDIDLGEDSTLTRRRR